MTRRNGRAGLRWIGLAAWIAAAAACDGGQREVVVYCSLDQHYSQPILEAFERQSGIRVRARFDTEADKTVGLFHRLVEERERPRADVFWSSEALRTALLGPKGILAPLESRAAAAIPERFRDPEGRWCGFAGRLRVLIYNTRKLKPEEAPRKLRDLTLERWRGQVAIARPLAGTTQTHFAALWQRLGKEQMLAFCEALLRNQVRVASGNAAVRDMVARGEVAVGLTDTDDALEGIRRGDPLALVIPDQGSGEGEEGAFLIPNTVARIAGGPNPEPAAALVEYLLSADVEAALARGGSAQIPLRPGVDGPAELPPASRLRLWTPAAADAAALEASEAELRRLFLR